MNVRTVSCCCVCESPLTMMTLTVFQYSTSVLFIVGPHYFRPATLVQIPLIK